MIHYPKYLSLSISHNYQSLISEQTEKEQLVATTRTPFEKLTAIHPNRRITLETSQTPVSMRLMDLFVPLGFGHVPSWWRHLRPVKPLFCGRLPLRSRRTILKPAYFCAWWMNGPKRSRNGGWRCRGQT